MDGKQVCVVVGVGPGNGAALARRFAAEGWAVALLARGGATSDALAARLPDARAFACDVTDPDAIERVFDAIAREMGPVRALLYNADVATWGNVEQVDPAALEQSFCVGTLGLLRCAQKVIPGMKALGGGSIIVIGATASRRGVARTAGFAPAKSGQRALCESMARHLWPRRIHVALVILDGVVDLPKTRALMADKPDEFFLSPDAVAATAFHLATQDPSGWSFEVEARPFGEPW